MARAYVTTNTSTYVWSTWCETATNTVSTMDVWPVWVDNGTSATATYTADTTQTVWLSWIDYGNGRRRIIDARPMRTPEQEAEYARMCEANRLAAQQRETEAKEADARARELLETVLSPEQRDQFKQHGHFVVRGRRHRYRVRRGRVGNIDVIGKDGRISHRLCFHPGQHVPDHDVMVAQMLVLQNDEDLAIRVANRHPYSGPNEPVLEAMH